MLIKGRWLLLALTAAVLLVAPNPGSAVAQSKSSVSHDEKMRAVGIDPSTGEINEDAIRRANPDLQPANKMLDINEELERRNKERNSASAPKPKQEVQPAPASASAKAEKDLPKAEKDPPKEEKKPKNTSSRSAGGTGIGNTGWLLLALGLLGVVGFLVYRSL